jgi:hypothetical protein
LYIRQKAIRGRIEHFTKTESGTELECEDGEIIGRDIDLSKDLAARLRAFVGNRRSGLVFCKENGEQCGFRTMPIGVPVHADQLFRLMAISIPG